MKMERLIAGALFALLSLNPAGALAEEGSFDDSRRPELKMSKREDVPYDLGNSGRFDGSVGMELGDSDWEEYYFQRIDLSAVMGRLRTVLTDEKYMGSHSEAQSLADYLAMLGFFNYHGAETEMKISGEDIHYSSTTSFSDLAPESYYSRYFAIADEVPVSSKFVKPGQYLLYVSMPNMYEMLMLQLEQSVAQQKMIEENAPPTLLELMGGTDVKQIEELLAVMKVMGVDKIVNDSLTGELAFVIYEIENVEGMTSGSEPGPQNFDVAIMLGLKDASYLEKLSGSYGPDLGLAPATEEGGWKVQRMQGEESIGMFYNNEILVVTPDIAEVMANVTAAQAGGAINAGPCQYYMDLNLARLDGEIISPLTAIALQHSESDPDFERFLSSVSFLVDKPAGENLGSLRISSSHPGGSGQQMDFALSKSALRYAGYYLLGGLGALAHNEEWLEELGVDELLEQLPEALEGASAAAAPTE